MLEGDQAGFRQKFTPFQSGICFPRVLQVLSVGAAQREIVTHRQQQVVLSSPGRRW